MNELGWESVLYLGSGHVFSGLGFGFRGVQGGEAVFNTGLSGYQEVFSDPSYLQQIVVMTYPHIGNTGINFEDYESNSIFLSGVVVREYCETPSSWRSKTTLHQWLSEKKVPGISDVDTRRITQVLRDEGAQNGIIFPVTEIKPGESKLDAGKRLLTGVPSMEGLELVSQVSTKKEYEFGQSQGRRLAVVYDFGVKTNILRSLERRGFDVRVVPHRFPHQETLKMNPSIVVLSNGPGDPATVEGVVEPIQGLTGKVPIFAICMGHQLLARSLGASTYKLKFGHHGINHPVEDRLLKKITITSQNHGFAVQEKDLRSKDIEITQVSLNDGSVEGFYSKSMRLLSVQYHPEAAPGPTDGSLLFDYFIRGFLQ